MMKKIGLCCVLMITTMTPLAAQEIHEKLSVPSITETKRLNRNMIKLLDTLKEIRIWLDNIFSGGAVQFSDVKDSIAEIQKTLHAIEQNIIVLKASIGDLDQASIDSEDLPTVQSIDEAELSIIQWLKTIYRQVQNSPIS